MSIESLSAVTKVTPQREWKGRHLSVLREQAVNTRQVIRELAGVKCDFDPTTHNYQQLDKLECMATAFYQQLYAIVEE